MISIIVYFRSNYEEKALLTGANGRDWNTLSLSRLLGMFKRHAVCLDSVFFQCYVINILNYDYNTIREFLFEMSEIATGDS